jgi:hypothetical protein
MAIKELFFINNTKLNLYKFKDIASRSLKNPLFLKTDFSRCTIKG